MTIVAHEYTRVVGVDTHAQTHTYTMVHAPTGEAMETRTFPITQGGLDRAAAWMVKRAAGGRLLASVECTGSYGANLARTLDAAGVDTAEAKPPARKNRTGRGKSDPIDAEAAARSVLGVDTAELARPRTTSPHHAELQLLLAERDYLAHLRRKQPHGYAPRQRPRRRRPQSVDGQPDRTPLQVPPWQGHSARRGGPPRQRHHRPGRAD
ncbi:MAG: IS110 family transposase [Bifidobacteriaceae bacterium]|nr:IS110 family transposase [Bifidobacteriaceae bacterium]